MICPPPPPTISDASAAIKCGKLLPTVLLEQVFGRIKALDPSLNAYHKVFWKEARQEAIEADKEITSGNYRGPLHGIPVAVKDVFYLKGHPTTSNSRSMLDWHANEDATVVKKLKDAGAILTGQLNTFEFTFGGRPTFDAAFPPALNPWNTEYVTGGSSSGSGAAVAAGLCLGALGSDAGGSIRTPASFCGIAGLKPTYGLVSSYGDMPLTHSFDCVGPMAWNSQDCAIILQEIAGYDKKDPVSAELPPQNYNACLSEGATNLKIGLIRHFYTDDWDAPKPIVGAVDNIAAILQSLGAHVEEISVSHLMDWHAVGRVLLPAEAYAIHEDRLKNHWEDYGSLARGRMMLGATIRAADYIQAQRRRSELMEEMDNIFSTYDLIITTATLDETPLLTDKNPYPNLETPMIQVPFNLTLHPAISIRAGFSENKMPIGVQIIGRHWEEAKLLGTAHAVEKSLNLLSIRPTDRF